MESLADFLGVVDPRPKEAQPASAPSDPLVDIADPTEFCQRILRSREFRQYVMNGIVLGDIPPAVLCRVIDHAWGKPVEHVEVNDISQRLEDMSVEELEARALFLAEVARRIRTGGDVPNDPSSESVH